MPGFLYRNPTTDRRPNFRDIVLSLTGSERDNLNIPKEANETHQLAGELGAPLEAGKKMYFDLQQTYCISN